MKMRRFQRDKDDGGSSHGQDRTEEPEVVQLDEAQLGQLSAVFAAPRWLRDLGLAAWLITGVLLVLVGVIWLVGATSEITQPLIAAFVVACVFCRSSAGSRATASGGRELRGSRSSCSWPSRSSWACSSSAGSSPRPTTSRRTARAPPTRSRAGSRTPESTRPEPRARAAHGEGGRPPDHLHAHQRPRYRHRRPDLTRARALLLPAQPLLPAQGRPVAALLGRGPLRHSETRRADHHRRRDHLVPALLRRRDHRRRLQRDRRRRCRAAARSPAGRHDRGRDLLLRLHPVHRGVLRGRVRGGDRARLGRHDHRAHHARGRHPGERSAAADRPADRLRGHARSQPARRPHRHDQRRRSLRNGRARPRRPAHVGRRAHRRDLARAKAAAGKKADEEAGVAGPEPEPAPG